MCSTGALTSDAFASKTSLYLNYPFFSRHPAHATICETPCRQAAHIGIIKRRTIKEFRLMGVAIRAWTVGSIRALPNV